MWLTFFGTHLDTLQSIVMEGRTCTSDIYVLHDIGPLRAHLAFAKAEAISEHFREIIYVHTQKVLAYNYGYQG